MPRTLSMPSLLSMTVQSLHSSLFTHLFAQVPRGYSLAASVLYLYIYWRQIRNVTKPSTEPFNSSLPT